MITHEEVGSLKMSQYSYEDPHFEGSFPVETTIMVEENVQWDQNNEHVEDDVDFHDDTMTETINDTYMTATGENTTQYFSVLEGSSNETILNEVSDVDLDSSMSQSLADQNAFNDDENQVVLYRLDGSDDLYGIQLGRDDSGNLQKYQFKVRQTDEGTLEALPESIQILPMDNDDDEMAPQNEVIEQLEEDIETEVESLSVLVKQEHVLENILPESDDFEEQIFESKEGILDANISISEKQEFFEANDSEMDFQANGNVEYFQETVEAIDEMPRDPTGQQETSIEVNGHPIYDAPEFLQPHVCSENPTEIEVQGHYEQMFVRESHVVEEALSREVPQNMLSSSTVETFLNHQEDDENESEDYETVEGDHITAEVDENVPVNPIKKTIILDKLLGRRKVIKNIIRKVKVKETDYPGHFHYLVVRDREKENLVNFPAKPSPVVRTNPRSILKTSLPVVSEPKKTFDEVDRFDKRFAKSKEAQQARQFHNFIAQTKIIHAPVRQQRLPRKQKIKPMERNDEEIVVQEVVVSSKGFVEAKEGVKDRGPLKSAETILLSSDDEDDVTDGKRKRKTKKRPTIEITISDSDDIDSDPVTRTVETQQSEENKQSEKFDAKKTNTKKAKPKSPTRNEEKPDPPKRGRGRPCKVPKQVKTVYSEPEEEIIVIRVDNKCTLCPKSFPSVGALRSHMQFHVYNTEMKYICEKCGEQFKNSILLKRHANAHLTKMFTCSFCEKVFSDQSQLIAHRRIHIKEKMFKVTNRLADTPKKMKNLRTPINSCQVCGKGFSNAATLETHSKLHKRYNCLSCRASFLSKLTLDYHLRSSCIKSPQVRLSKLQSPRKLVPPIMELPSGVKASASGIVTNIKCDSCPLTFVTYTSLFKHKVLKHGLETPNKTLISTLDKRDLRKHSGVPANDKLKRAYHDLRNRLRK